MAWNRDSVYALAGAAQRGLANAGIEVAWGGVGLLDTSRGPLAVLRVDLERTRVPVARLAHENTIHHLSTFLGKQVVLRNTRGISYGVLLSPPRKARLPEKVELPDPPGRLMVPFGRTADGEDLWVPLQELDALLVSGTTGYGKTTFLSAMLASLLANNGPEDLHLYVVDMKEIELVHWSAAPHLRMPVASTDEAAAAVLGRLTGVIEERKALFVAERVNRLERYAEKTGKPLPRVLLVVDELAELGIDMGDLQTIRATGRAFGVHCVLSTQFPNAEVIKSIINANIPNRVTGFLPWDGWYRMAIKVGTGERFPKPEMTPGRMVGRVRGGWVKFQAFWLSDKDLERIGAEVAAGKSGGGLGTDEALMVAWALSENGGYLGQAEIAREMGLSPYKAEQLSGKWQKWGWLQKDPLNSNKCRVTGALQAVLGRSRGFQAFQVPE